MPLSVIGGVFGAIVETMYFCAPQYSGKAAVRSPAIGASVAFSGSVCGELRLVVSEELAARMAADFLATDLCGLSREQIEATTGELANIVCGATPGTCGCRTAGFVFPCRAG